MKWIKLFEEFESHDLNSLKNYLNKFSIPIDNWGTGKSKTIEHLFDELKNEECFLTEIDGTLVRSIEFVGVKIYHNENNERWVLKEDRQEFNDGRIRRRNMPSSVSEKMKFGEDILKSAIRGIKEELGVDISTSQLSKRKDLFYDGGSVSYPGLKTKYKGHQFICELQSHQFDPSGYVEVQRDKKTYFVWHKL
jgi:hypothetical protein